MCYSAAMLYVISATINYVRLKLIVYPQYYTLKIFHIIQLHFKNFILKYFVSII